MTCSKLVRCDKLNVASVRNVTVNALFFIKEDATGPRKRSNGTNGPCIDSGNRCRRFNIKTQPTDVFYFIFLSLHSRFASPPSQTLDSVRFARATPEIARNIERMAYCAWPTHRCLAGARRGRTVAVHRVVEGSVQAQHRSGHWLALIHQPLLVLALVAHSANGTWQWFRCETANYHAFIVR